MFDIGFNEMFVVGVVVLVITGPKEIPKVLKTTAKIIRKVRSVKSDIQTKVDNFVDMNDDYSKDLKQAVDLPHMKKLKSNLQDQLATNFNPIKEQLNHVNQLEESIKNTSNNIKLDTKKTNENNQNDTQVKEMSNKHNDQES